MDVIREVQNGCVFLALLAVAHTAQREGGGIMVANITFFL